MRLKARWELSLPRALKGWLRSVCRQMTASPEHRASAPLRFTFYMTVKQLRRPACRRPRRRILQRVSRQNVEIVRALQPSGVDLVEANQREPFAEPRASLFAEDFEAIFIARESRAGLGPAKGLEGLSAAWRDWLEPWERYEIHADEFH